MINARMLHLLFMHSFARYPQFQGEFPWSDDMKHTCKTTFNHKVLVQRNNDLPTLISKLQLPNS